MIHFLEYPFTSSNVRELKTGDLVGVSGRITTGRDRVHEFLFRGGLSPVELKSGAIYHCGPVVVREQGEWLVCAAGPTTSMREEHYMPRIIRQHGIRVIIGKGGMGKDTLDACAGFGCVYLNTVGGAAQVLADRVKTVSGVHFLEEFGCAEAMWELEVDQLPAVVTMDAHGNSLHELVSDQSRRLLLK